MKNRTSWIIAVIAGYVFSGLPAWLMGKAGYGLLTHILVFFLVTFGVVVLLHYAAIWRNNRKAARDRKAEHDYGVGECQEATCISTKVDNDLIDDDHQQVQEMEAQKSPLMQERAKNSMKRKRKTCS